MNGTVTTFDVERGLGELLGDDAVVYPFHCTEIADGSRRIEEGITVRFEVLAKLGRYEAGRISPA